MGNWKKWFEESRQNEEAERFSKATSKDNLLTLAGNLYDSKNSGTSGYTSLSKRWEDLYKRALDYYNNEAHTDFYNAYSGTRNKAGYVSDTGTWYSDLEGLRDTANKDVDALLAELDQYSRYYNPKAVSYVRDLITKRKSSYDDVMTDAGKFRDYWSQWATEGDYNNAVWESNFLKLVEDGKYDEAQASISAQMDTFKQTNPEVSFYNNPEAWAKGKKLDEYNKYLQQMRENAEYKPFVDKYSGMSKEELQSTLEGLKVAYHNAKTSTPSGADPLGLGQQHADDTERELGYVNYLINKDSPEWQAKVAAAEAAKAKQERVDNASGWERFGAWLADTANNALYATNSMVEGIGDSANNGYVALGDAINVIRRKILDTVETRADLRPYAKRLKQDIEKWNEDRQGYIDTTQYDWAMDLSNLNEDHYIYDDLSWMSDYPELQRQFNGLIQGVAGMAPAILAAPVTGGTSLSWIPSAYMTLGAAGGATNEALDAGNSPLDAAAYGAAIGALEYGSEMIGGSLFGGATELMDTPLGRWIVKHGADKFFGKGVGKAAYTFASEGFEESIMDIATPLAQSAFGIGNSRDKYFGDNWEEGWQEVISGIPETFVVGGAVGAIVEGFHSGASAIANRDKGGFRYNKIADEMTIIENALKSQEAVGQSTNANQKIVDAFSEKATQKVAAAVKNISKTMQQLSAEQRAAVFADAPVLEMFLNEDGSINAEFDYATNTTIRKNAEAANRKQKIADYAKQISPEISDKQARTKMAEALTKIAYGENVSNADLRKIAQSKKALKVIEEITGTKYKAGEVTVKELRKEISSKQDSTTRLSSENILATASAFFNMDEVGERSLMVSYATDLRNSEDGKIADPEVYAAAYNRVYSAGKKGADVSKIISNVSSILSDSAIAQAYRAGQNAAGYKNSQQGLQNGSQSGTISTDNMEVQNEQELHLRDSGERNDGANSGGQVSAVEGNARQNKGRGEGRTGPRDSEASSLSYDREVSAKELVKGGLESSKVWLPTEGSETESMKEARKIAESRGLKVVFFGNGNLKVLEGTKIISARAYIQGDTVYVRVDHAGFAADQLMKHEAAHDMIDKGEINVADVKKLISERFSPEEIDAVINSYAIAYEKAGMTADEIWEEVICDSVAEMNSFEGTDFTAAAEMAADFLPDLKEAVLESKKESRGPPAEAKQKFDNPIEAKESGEVSDAHFSIEFAEDIAENQRAYVDRGNAAITAEELDKAIADTAKMVEAMKPYSKILPQDKVGKTLVKNGSYDMSVENTTICIRTLAYNSFVDMVSEKVGRPLTQMESFLVSQKLYDIAKEPQCLYCYVSLDRKAFNEMVIRYIEQRDAAIAAYKKAGEPKIPSTFNAEWPLFKSFLEGRKPTKNMWDRYTGWIKSYKNGDRLVTLSDISTEAKRLKLVEDGGKVSAQVADILKYAQSASWAKKQTKYVAYYDEILKLKPGVIKNLNSHYGMRWYSFSDYSGAFIVENMQQVTDAAIRGLKGLSYTKDTDYAEIFAPTGMNINISVYAKKGENGYVIDPKQSADIDKAIKLRKQYPNVGIVVVATDKAGVEWALAQEWSDVVIPFHTVRTGADVADFYKWEIFNTEQSDVVSDDNLWDAYVKGTGKKKVSKNIYPSEHQNDRETYLRLCSERGLTPRFNSFINNPNYMKLVNETRQSEAQTQPLKPDFNVDAAERSFDKFVDKGGYYEGWYNDGVDVDGEADIVAADVVAGKRANEVDYGRQDISYEDIQKTRKKNREHGHASIDLNEMMEETESKPKPRELSSREILADMLESVAETDRDKSILNRYKDHLSKIENNRAEIAKLKEEKKAAKDKQKKAISQKIEKLQGEIDYSEKRLITLEDATTLKYLVSKERKARQAEAHLAGQMAQGRRDAEILRHANEKLAAQKTSYNERLAEQKKSAREALEEQAKRYQESRAKSVEGRRKTDMKHKIQRVVAELDTLLRKGNKKSNVKLGLQDAVAASLEAFDINSEKTARYAKEIASLDAKIAAATDPDVIAGLIDRREKKRRNSEVLADKLTAMKQAYEDIHNNNDEGENYPAYYRAEAKTIMDRISDTLAKVGDTPISEMSSAQLQSVYDMYRMVLTTVRDANTAFIDGKLEDLTENAVAMENDLNKIKKLPEERLRAGDNARGFVWNELTPYYAFKRIGSQTLMRYYDELVRGQDVYARDLDEAKQFAEDARKKYKANKWNRNEIKTFKDKDGRTFRLNLEQMMSIYAYSKREQALDHMERGGFFYNNKETFRKDKKTGILEFIASNESGYKVNSAVLAKIAATLTTEQRAYVDEMQAYLTAMGEKGNEVSRQMWGIDIFKEKVYFPLKSKEDFIYQANTPAETSSLKNDGMTKETKPHASNPIVLESFDEVWANHVEKMSKYHGFVIPIDNLNKIINYGSWIDGEAQSISTMLEARYSSAVNDYLNTFIKDLNGAKAQNGGLLGVMSNWLTKFKKTAVAASLSVVVQQPTAILRAASEIDPKYFAHLPKVETLNKKWEKIKKYAPVAIIKDIGGFDAGSGRQITEWLNADTRQGIDKAMNKVDDLTMYGAALGDQIGWGSIWTAVEREVQARQKLKYGTEEFYEACGKRFTDVIVKTQVYDSTLSRSGFMRGKDGLLKMATAFMGEPTLSVNMLADAVLQGKRGTMKKRQVVRTVAAVYTATIAASLIKSLIYALRDDDEDESYVEKYLQALGSNILIDALTINMIPILRDVISIFTGWEVERADMALVQDLYNSIMSLDSEEKSVYRKIEDFGGALAAFAGIPGKNLLRTGREIYNAINDAFDGIEGGDLGGAFVEGITGEEKSKSQTLYEALVGGEKERIAALRKNYKSDKEYKEAIRKALRDYDPRIKKAAQALYEGDLITRNEIMLEIMKEGVFDKETLDRAIDAEMQAIKNAEKDPSEDEGESDWTSVYSPSDIPSAFDYCSDQLALEIIAELTDIKVEEKVETAKAKADAQGKKFDEAAARKEAEDEVRTTLRSTLTKHYKPLYYSAYLKGDRKEMERIRKILITSKLYVYKTRKDVDDVLEEWIESYDED